MGKFKGRLTITFTAKLVSWRLRENGAVEGVIAMSIASDYKDGDHRIFMNTSLEHWPRVDGGWKDHFVMTTQTGLHFRLDDVDRWEDENASLA